MRQRLRLGQRIRLVLFLVFLFLSSSIAQAGSTAKNVILLIPDGCSFEQYTFARWYKGAPLAMDAILTGAVKTYIADSVVADSAPTATAYASGVRSSDKVIGLGPKKTGLLPVETAPMEDLAPLATVLEAAGLSGRSVGVVATSRITHATPAAFISHVANRAMEEEIMEQAVYHNLDVAFGGGGRFLLPKSQAKNLYGEALARDPHEDAWQGKGRRSDGENLLEVLKARGYTVAATREEMRALKKPRAFGMFALSHMAPEIDRSDVAPTEPDLAEMTLKAIELLRQNPKGFFLMVEGSQVDWACHANDPAYLISDLLAFDRAVEAALAFATKDGNTLVIVCPDHNTGGFTVGNYGTSGTYSQMKLEEMLAPVKAMKVSSERLAMLVGKDRTPEKVISMVKEYWGIEPTADQAQAILGLMKKQYRLSPGYAFGEVLCPAYTMYGWTTHGHCGGDVPLGAMGPGKPAGLIDGPEVGRALARAMGLDLAAATERLFGSPEQVLPGCQWSLDESDPANPVVRISYQNKAAILPVNKNLFIRDGKIEQMEGICLYVAETRQAYIPRQVAKLW